MQGMRRLVTRPPSASVPMPGLGRPVDLSKVLACEALAELSRGGPVTITDLSTAMHLERSTVSRLVGEAEAEGLVERGTHPDDRRMGSFEPWLQAVTHTAQAQTTGISPGSDDTTSRTTALASPAS